MKGVNNDVNCYDTRLSKIELYSVVHMQPFDANNYHFNSFFPPPSATLFDSVGISSANPRFLNSSLAIRFLF